MGLPKYPDKDSEFWDGRWCQRHPNGYPVENAVDHLREHLLNALSALSGEEPEATVLPISSAESLRRCYQYLDDLTHYVPKVEGWACYTTYRDGWGGLGRKVIWSAHFDQATAELWLPVWQKRYGHRTDYEWHVGLIPVHVTDFIDPECSIELRSHRMGPVR